jgi:hypothetical protein
MIGERVVCIKESSEEVGKLFTVTNTKTFGKGYVNSVGTKTIGYITVISDDGISSSWVDSSYFRPLSEIREDKLKTILQ